MGRHPGPEIGRCPSPRAPAATMALTPLLLLPPAARGHCPVRPAGARAPKLGRQEQSWIWPRCWKPSLMIPTNAVEQYQPCRGLRSVRCGPDQ